MFSNTSYSNLNCGQGINTIFAVSHRHHISSCSPWQAHAGKSHTKMATWRYDYVTEPADDLKCLICLDVAQHPLQHEVCGKLFCKECLEKHGRDKPCPNCKVQGQSSKYYEDKRGMLTECRGGFTCVGSHAVRFLPLTRPKGSPGSASEVSPHCK